MKPAGWIRFVASRWFRSGRDSGPSLAPATAGIAVGVAALLCVIGVMNGFQMGFIDAVLELDSYHVRVPAAADRLPEIRRALPEAVAALPFVDLRTMAANRRGKAAAIRIKIIPDNALSLDPSLDTMLQFRFGSLCGGLAIGSELSRQLDLRVGDTVSVLAVSVDEDEGVDAGMVELEISGIYHSGYYDFDAGLAYLPESAAGKLAATEEPVIGLKLADRYDDARALARLEAAGIHGASSWRDYNRAFFGALRMEKSVMMMLVGLIFIVVGVNIFHSLRKTVYSRVEDIATLKALGASPGSVRRVFMLNGLTAGFGGAGIGLCLGLLVAFNVNSIFAAIEFVVGFIYQIAGGAGRIFSFFSPDLFYIGDVPVRLTFVETLFITIAGAVSALAAAWAASAKVSRILPSEVLRDE